MGSVGLVGFIVEVAAAVDDLLAAINLVAVTIPCQALSNTSADALGINPIVPATTKAAAARNCVVQFEVIFSLS